MDNNQCDSSIHKTIVFAKEVVKYFMDFLETDFHKRRNPKRSIKLRNDNNFQLGFNLSKFPSFYTYMHKQIMKVFQEDNLFIKKGQFTTKVPQRLLELINLHITKIDEGYTNKILKKTSDLIEINSQKYEIEFDRAFSETLEKISLEIKEILVVPFLKHLLKSLEESNLADDNNFYIMTENLSSILVNMMSNKISELIRRTIVKDKLDLIAELKTTFEIIAVKNAISIFFDEYQLADVTSEFFELDKNKKILDKQELYLYFYDITYKDAKYPIFYIPFKLVREKENYKVIFDSQLFINKKALVEQDN